jgi:methylglutamate dehydrogenase subunit D
MPEPVTLERTSAFGSLLAPAGDARAPGVVVRERHLALATVIALDGGRAAVARGLASLGLALPEGARRVAADGSAVVGLGPRSWLVARDGDSALAEDLSRALAGAAAVSDQSDGYGVLRLTGPAIRALLEKGVGIDLHDRAFPPGSAAATTCAHVAIVLWRLEDSGGEAVFEVAAPRSYAASFWRFVASGAAEYGLAVEA